MEEESAERVEERSMADYDVVERTTGTVGEKWNCKLGRSNRVLASPASSGLVYQKASMSTKANMRWIGKIQARSEVEFGRANPEQGSLASWPASSPSVAVSRRQLVA